MEKIKSKTVWYYNNNPVIIIKRETEDFFLVQAMQNVNTDIRGSDFCTACQIGHYSSHSCDEAQNVIDVMIEEADRGDVFHVREESLREKPIEFLLWQKLDEQNKKLAEQIEPHKNDLTRIKNIEYQLKNLQEDKQKYSSEVKQLKGEVKDYKKESKELKEEIKKLQETIKEEKEQLEKFIPKEQDDRMLELD